VTIAKLISKYDAFVALGCVIKEKLHISINFQAVVNAIRIYPFKIRNQ
jgi:6,7-dimethyl-8-ribityllumazine synthase